jgi:molecular chaperone GrpE (heat shock protein)
MDFAAELQKLLNAEEIPPVDPLSELVIAHAQLLDNLQKNNNGISLQVEEIYDIIKESDENSKEVKNAAKRESILLDSLVAMSDLLDSLLPYVQEHIQVVADKKEEAMKPCGLEPLGFLGERLDPRLHTVVSAKVCDAPLESIVCVLESGYVYRGKILRKAKVIISKGDENE